MNKTIETGLRTRQSATETERLAHRRKKAAAILGVSESLMRKWEHTGHGPKFVRVGRAVLYPARSLSDGSSLTRRTPRRCDVSKPKTTQNENGGLHPAVLTQTEPTYIVAPSRQPRQHRAGFPSPSLRSLLEASELGRFLGMERRLEVTV